ncbi:MAG: ABC transporter permease subunit, partial [Silvanigrellaceae bacterium]|nr:ABC transporter permease subunit [Silvanigrellaceae bacterium]
MKRLLATIPMFFLMTGIYFTIQNSLPGGPVEEALARIKGLSADEGFASRSAQNPEKLEKLRHELEKEYGLDKPAFVRYFIWLKNILCLEFGNSITTRRPAMEQIIERFPISLSFGLPSFFLAYLICIPLGVMMALRDGSRFDALATLTLFVTYSIPALVFAMLFLLFLCTDRFLSQGALFPLGGWRSDNYELLSPFAKFYDVVHHMFLPVLASMI